jgi:hypothetical protein
MVLRQHPYFGWIKWSPSWTGSASLADSVNSLSRRSAVLLLVSLCYCLADLVWFGQ